MHRFVIGCMSVSSHARWSLYTIIEYQSVHSLLLQYTVASGCLPPSKFSWDCSRSSALKDATKAFVSESNSR